MNTLLIVEDNDFERNALQHYIDWDVLGIRVVDTAANGQEGLEKAILHRPDIVISDIMMPGMNGIEMAKEIVRANSNTKFVFSSGHDDVGLLKEALELRAYNYLIKPLKQEELIACLKKIASAAMEEKLTSRATKKILEQFQNNLQHLQSLFLQELMTEPRRSDDATDIYARASDLKLPMMGPYKLALIEIEFAGHSDIFERSDRLALILFELRNAMSDKNTMFMKDGDGRITGIVHSLKEDSDKESRILLAIESKVAELTRILAFRYVIGASGGAPNLTDLGLLYRQCLSTLNDKVGFGYGRLYSFDRHNAPATAPIGPDAGLLPGIVDDIVSAVCEGKDCEEGIRRLSDALTEEMTDERPLKLERLQSVVVGLFSRLYMNLENRGEKVSKMAADETEIFREVIAARTLPDIVEYASRILRRISSYMSRQNQSKENYVIQEILTILHRDYGQAITLSFLSERVFLSPNYLRILFKEKMKISIQDYLTQLRINKAKELLRQKRYKVHEIGGMVGYENGTYFNLVFKNSVRMTPKEYRNKHVD